MTSMNSDNFENILLAMRSGRDIDRIDILGINQTFLNINKSVKPMQETVGLFLGKFFSEKHRAIIERIAQVQDETQVLPYHNACQASKEMLIYLLLNCLELDDVQVHNKNMQSELEIGLFALSSRYFMASNYNREWRMSGMSPEMHYADTALSQGLFDGLNDTMKTKIWDGICQSGISNRVNIRKNEPVYIRNISDSVIIPFIGISYELNKDDRTRIRTQNDMEVGEFVEYDKVLQNLIQPMGSALGTSYDIFIQRMMEGGNSSFKIKSASPKLR